MVYNQEVCDRVVSEDLFLIVYYPDKYKSQIMYDEAVDDSLAALKLIPDWFVASKMIKKHLLLSTQTIKYSTLMTILMVMSYFLVMKLVFLI